MKKNSIIFSSYFIIYIIIGTLLYLFPFRSDDWIFSEATNIRQCISYTWDYYYKGNGRIIPNFLSYIYCGMMERWEYALLTSFFYICLLYLISKLSGINKNPFLISLCIFVLPVHTMTIFWRCGNANYLFPSICMLFTILFFSSNRNNYTILQNILLFFLSIITGMSHEAVGIPLIGSFIIFIFLNRKKSIHKKVILAGLFFGLFINIIAPGTSVRVESIQNAPFFNIIKFVFSEFKTSWFSTTNIILLFLLIIKGTYKSFFSNNKLIIITWIINYFFLFAIAIKSISVAGRVLFYQECIALILFLKLIKYIIPSLLNIRLLEICAFIFFLIFCIGKGHHFKTYNMLVDKEVSILQHSNDSILIANYLPLTPNPANTTNIGICKVFNKPKLYGLKKQIYRDIYINGKVDSTKQIVLNNQNWYNYSNYYIKEIKPNEHYNRAYYVSIPYLQRAPDIINTQLSKVQKKAELPIIVIQSKNGKRFIIVSIGGEKNAKKIISLILE